MNTIDQYLARGLRSAREYSDRQMFRLIGGGRELPPMEDSDPPSSLERFQKPSLPLRAQTFTYKGYTNNFMERYAPPIRAQPSADVSRDVDRYFRRDPSQDLDRRQKAQRPLLQQTFAYKGWADNDFSKPKQPLRYTPSADINTDVKRYFRTDSPTDRIASPVKEPTTQRQDDRQPPPLQLEERQRPDWLQEEKGPSRLQENYGSPRFNEGYNTQRNEGYNTQREPVNDGYNTQRMEPIRIRDPHEELTPQQREKKVREFQIAQQDLAEAARRKREREEERQKEKQLIRQMITTSSNFPFGRPGGGAPVRIQIMQENYQPFNRPGGGAPIVQALMEDDSPYGRPGGGAPKGDNRKMKFTEHQLTKPSSPKFNEPPRPTARYDPMEVDAPSRLLREQDLKMDRVRNGYPEERREEALRAQEQEIDSLRRQLSRLQKAKPASPVKQNNMIENKTAGEEDKIANDMSQQENQLMQIQQEINNKKKPLPDQQFMRPAGLPTHRLHELKREIHPEIRSHSGYDDDYSPYEPPTDRLANYQSMRDRDFGGTMIRSPNPASYINATPRRQVAQRYYNKTTYGNDFDPPFQRKGRQLLENPNKEQVGPVLGFGSPGYGAPRVDATGQRITHIQKSMEDLGRENSAHAKRAMYKRELLLDNGRLAAEENRRKQLEKAEAREPFVPMAAHMRAPNMNTGYPKFKPSGLIDNHHLQGSVSNPVAPPPLHKQREYHNELENQIMEREKARRLNKMAERQLEQVHAVEFGKRFDRDNYGGGAPKGEYIRKVKLDNAIHNPQDASPYYNKVRMYEERHNTALDHFKPRITLNSTHKNLYEFPEGNIQLEYRGRAPFAENGHTSSNY